MISFKRVAGGIAALVLVIAAVVVLTSAGASSSHATASEAAAQTVASRPAGTKSFISAHQHAKSDVPAAVKRLESHFVVFSRRRRARVTDASAKLPAPPPMIVDRYGLSLAQAVPISLGSAFVAWAIPGTMGMCVTAVPTPAATDHDPSGGSCSISIAAAETQGVSVTTDGVDGQRYVVGIVPSSVVGINLTSTSGTTTHPAVTNSGFYAPITSSGYRSLAVVDSGGKATVVGTNSP